MNTVRSNVAFHAGRCATGFFTASIRVIVASVLLLFATGCTVKPAPGTATVLLRITAEPKTGAGAHATNDASMDYVPASLGPMSHINYESLEDIIVWLEPLDGKFTIPPGRWVELPNPIASTGINTSVVPICVGESITIHNGGPVASSAFCVSDGNDFDLPSIAPAATASTVVRSPGLMEILYGRNALPIATFYAVNSPWAARTAAGETVTFSNVPPGRYRACAWHPRLPGCAIDLTLSADQTTKGSLCVSVNNLGGAH